MNRTPLWQITLIAVPLLITGCHGSYGQSGETLFGGDETAREGTNPPKRSRAAAYALEARLMSYADRYLSKASEATDIFQRQVQTRAARELGLSTFIFPGLTVIGIATGGDPGADLLDMVAFATLQRESLENGWAEEVLGQYAAALIATQKQLEKEIWEIALESLEPGQIESLREAIQRWRRANPTQRFVSNVKFDDVAISRGQDQSAQKLQEDSSGWLAPIDAAVRESEEIRLMAQRSLYLMQRMPPLLLAQTRFILHEEISPQQIETLLQDISAFQGSVAAAQKNLAEMPIWIDRERVAMTEDLGKIPGLFEQGKAFTQSVQTVLDTVERIELEYPNAGATLNETLKQYRDLAQMLERSPPSDLRPKLEFMREINHTADDLVTLAKIFREENPELIRSTLKGLFNDLLLRAMGFVVFLFGMTLIYRYLVSRMR